MQTILFPAELLSLLLFQYRKLNCMEEPFLQEVLNLQPTVFDFSGKPVASQKYFNGPLEDIKNEFVITLLSLCDKGISICYGCTHELKYQGAIPAPTFDLVVVTKMHRDY